MNLYGKVVKLRAIEKEDMNLLLDMFNDPEIEKLVVGYAFPQSMNLQNKWFDNVKYDQNNIRLIIETEEDGSIGYATIVNIDWKNRSALHGIKISNKKFRAKGIGTDTVMTIMRYAFEELNLNRLYGSILDYNIGSQKLYINKCGWIKEGVQREYAFKNNKYHDNILVSILKSDYEKHMNELKYWDK